MANAQRDLSRVGRNLQKVGAGLTAGVTLPLVAIGTEAVRAFSELEGVQTAFERLDDPNLLKDLQAATKNTVSNLELMKSAVQASNFKIPLEELGGLLDFARRRAKDTGESVDFLVNSIVTGIGRKSPLILDNLGISATALKDKFNGAALASQSIADVTKAVGEIAQGELQAMGDDATTLKEVYLQIKATLQNTFADLGGILSEFARPLLESVREIANRFKDLSPETKKFIVILGGVAAAAGPLLALAGTILPAIGTGLTLLTGPIGLVVAGLTAIGVVIYKNWEPIKATLVDIANYFIDLYNESTLFRFAVEAIVTNFKNLFAVGKFVFDALGSIISAVAENIKNGFRPLGDLIKAVLTGDIKKIPAILAGGFKQGLNTSKGLIKDLDNDFQNLKETISGNINEGINNALRGKKYELLSRNVDTEAVKEKVSGAIAAAVNDGLKQGGGSPDLTPRIATVGVSIESKGIADPLQGTASGIDASAGIITTRLAEVRDSMTAFQEASVEIGLAVGDVFANMTGRLVESMGLADDGFEGFVKGFASTITELISMLLASAIAHAVTAGSMSALGTGVAAAFTSPAFIATAVGGVLAAFAAIPKFATGGIVGGSSYFGDQQLARVNSGELILNLAQQKNLVGALGGGANITLQPSLEVSGDKFRILLNRSDKSRARRT